jgi:hypothetical protein
MSGRASGFARFSAADREWESNFSSTIARIQRTIRLGWGNSGAEVVEVALAVTFFAGYPLHFTSLPGCLEGLHKAYAQPILRSAGPAYADSTTPSSCEM